MIKNMFRKKLGIFIAIFMVFALCMPAGYAGAAERTDFHTVGTAGNLQSAQTAKAKLSATKATVVIGSTLTLTVKNLDDSQVSVIKWKSNRTSIAKVNQKGVVTPVKVGTTTVKCTITYKDKIKQTLSCTVTVKKRVKATTIDINNAEKAASIKVGERVTLKAILSPANTTDQIYWFSSNKAVATVGLTSGKVTAKKEGTVVITAKAGLDKKGAAAKTNRVITEIKIEVKSEDEPLNATDESFFTWEKHKNNITITGYKEGLPRDVVIPKKINGVTVAEIGDRAFYKYVGLTSITIPNSVTSIGDKAFYSCNGLTSITIPDSVTSIGDSAFSYCGGLTSITIPDSVTSIGDSAFDGCDGLTSITIPNSVTSIGDFAFYSCNELTSITIPDSVTSIGWSAFSNCDGLTSITIPDSVTSIGDFAFSWCSGLTSITISNSVTSIGDSTFSYCSGLKNIQVAKENKIYDSRGNSNAIIETKRNYLIQGCENTIIPDSVTSIGDSAFSGCSRLTSITIPNNVTSIGNSAFSGCSGLKNIQVAEENKIYDSRENSNAIIETKRNCLIRGCENTIIPDSVTSIGDSAFSGCDGLIRIIIPSSVTRIGDSAFSGCDGLTRIIIPNSVTRIGDFAFVWCCGLTSITIPDSVTSIGDSVFDFCSEFGSELKIRGKKGSYAQKYAKEYNIPFVEE